MSIYSAQDLTQKLLLKNLITAEQLESLIRQSLQNDQDIEKLIAAEHLVTEENMAKVKSELSGIPYIDPSEVPIKHEALRLVPETIARKYNLIPVSSDNTYLNVAMVDPNDLEALEFLQRSSNLKIRPSFASEALVKLAQDKEYSKSLGEGVSQVIEQAAETTATRMQETLKNINQAEEIIKVSPVAQIVSVMLEYAVKSGASDIHVEPFETATRIRYRIDGDLQEKFPLPKTIHNSIVARVKILANMQIDEHRKPLDGKFKVIFGEKKTDLRVSTIPTVFGEKIVIRLLKDQKDTFTLRELGMWGKQEKAFDNALSQTTGILLTTGPTGSGKTVTNATALAKLNSVKVNIITLEDPVEIQIAGVNQVQINTQAGLTFASGLRSILRQDPNIIMVGEIRDSETAQLAIQAALTGHLVLATLHTNSAAGAIPRLIDMGVENFLLASTINVSLAQRLARKICNYCKEEYEPSPEVIEDIKRVLNDNLINLSNTINPFKQTDHNEALDTTPDPAVSTAASNSIENLSGKFMVDPKIKLYKGKGCDKCNNTGYKGRIGLFEVMEINEEISQLTLKRSSTDEIRNAAIKNGMITLVQDGYLKALWGVTSLEEVLTVADE
jgi:type IV pilus assembly protein PilB